MVQMRRKATAGEVRVDSPHVLPRLRNHGGLIGMFEVGDGEGVPLFDLFWGVLPLFGSIA